MSSAERLQKLKEIRTELLHEMGVSATGGAPPNPGKLRALRKNIARILTVENELKREKIGKKKEVRK